jgi:hypothetical protein
MILFSLLILCHHGLSSVQQMVKRILERKTQDDFEKWNKCTTDLILANLDEFDGPNAATVSNEFNGKCCGQFPDTALCKVSAEACRVWDKGDLPAGDSTKLTEVMCNAWCDEDSSADWCSSGLSAGAIAGIVVGVVVVLGAVAGVLVYFLVLKKKPPVGGAAEPAK